MSKLAPALVGVAIAIGLLAARAARKAPQPQHVPAAPPEGAKKPEGAPSSGMVVLRNGPIDNGIAVHSPFDGDRGIVHREQAQPKQLPVGADQARAGKS